MTVERWVVVARLGWRCVLVDVDVDTVEAVREVRAGIEPSDRQRAEGVSKVAGTEHVAQRPRTGSSIVGGVECRDLDRAAVDQGALDAGALAGRVLAVAAGEGVLTAARPLVRSNPASRMASPSVGRSLR